MAATKAAKAAPKKPAAKAKPAAKKPVAKPKAAPAAKAVELTPINDGVSIVVGDANAVVKINGTFDLDGLISVVKQVDHARAALS
jgi:hypothetical protein